MHDYKREAFSSRARSRILLHFLKQKKVGSWMETTFLRHSTSKSRKLRSLKNWPKMSKIDLFSKFIFILSILMRSHLMVFLYTTYLCIGYRMFWKFIARLKFKLCSSSIKECIYFTQYGYTSFLLLFNYVKE